MSLNGSLGITEIMFGDFITLCFDQIIQQISKIPEMYGRKLNLPLIIRTPMGGRRGYGPTHSQNLEKFFLFIPNINLIAINSVINPEDIYKKIIDKRSPYIVIEDKILYTRFLNSTSISGYVKTKTNEDFPTLIIKPNSIPPNLIIFLYGSMLDEVLKIIENLIEEEIFPVIICPTQLSPINIEPLTKQLKITNNLIFIEEGSSYTSLSSEICTYLKAKNFNFNLVGRISNESIIPCARNAENDAIPNSKNLLKNIIELYA